MREKLESFIDTAEFRIIDQRTHQYIETLPRAEAIEKYGKYEVWGSYTLGFTKDSKPDNPKFKTAVWIWRGADSE